MIEMGVDKYLIRQIKSFLTNRKIQLTMDKQTIENDQLR